VDVEFLNFSVNSKGGKFRCCAMNFNCINPKHPLYKPDARIILDDGQGSEHNVHRIIVAVESSFFESLFKFDRAKKVFHVGVIKKVSMDLFLRFCYQKKLKLTKDNVADMMITANYLGANNIMKKCEEYFIKNLDQDRPDLIKEYLTFADDYRFLDLGDKVREFYIMSLKNSWTKTNARLSRRRGSHLEHLEFD
jgi:hypothetical protein